MSKQISSNITTILFDLDNTLIPTRKGDTKACKKVSVFFFPSQYFSTQFSSEFLLALDPFNATDFGSGSLLKGK